DRAPALVNISLSIRPGERIAIVGHTGAGKSTLAKLLLRFYDPQSGGVRVDGTDIRNVTVESLRRNIGWVHQDTLLFGMSIEENIALGCPDASPEAIREVARRVCADEFIEALPDGYATLLGQGGTTLSGGQRQRLALARAMLRGAPILILDEPGTGLDSKTRTLVEQAWMSPENRATTLLICHRLNDMERFDRIVVLSGGRLHGIGSHEELLAAGGEYAALFAAGRDDRAIHPWGERAAC
ncbi:MAG: ABC transporter ATP-binding protein, partial [Phycisphaerae bacterium]